jgi:hypothetical protein
LVQVALFPRLSDKSQGIARRHPQRARVPETDPWELAPGQRGLSRAAPSVGGVQVGRSRAASTLESLDVGRRFQPRARKS